MKAMILAAGLGTRLRPLTDNRPKALVELSGRTLLEITLSRLRAFGVTEVIVNVHHFADRVIGYLKSNNNFGMRIEISREDILLDTGGGLKKAAWFFLEDSARPDSKSGDSSRGDSKQFDEPFLLFDDHLQLRGRRIDNKNTVISSEARNLSSIPLHALAFSGIHIISPRLLPMLTEEGVFSIIPSYLRLASQGEKILAFRADDYYWRDLGRPADLAQAALDLQQNA